MKEILNTLYVQTQGTYLQLDHETLKVKVEEVTRQVPLHHLGGIVAFGNVLFSPFLLHKCAQDGRSVVWLSRSGRFMGRLAGPTTGNVLLRRAQHEVMCDVGRCLGVARFVVAGKLQNTRAVLMRAAREAKDGGDEARLRAAAVVHAEGIVSCERAVDIAQLRGIEGFAAKAYFGAFGGMIRVNREEFGFVGRSKRPPRDGINALLSFAYTLLANECVSACEGVGLDPQMGFSHVLRPGRPSLALDLMEEFRPLVVDAMVLSCINRRVLRPEDFVTEPVSGAVSLSDDGRKVFLRAYEQKKQSEFKHPVMGRKCSYQEAFEIQGRLLSKYLMGETEIYPPLVLR